MDSTHKPIELVDPDYSKRFENVPFCTECHSHDNLDSIFSQLWDKDNPILVRNSFCDHVFRCVFFHQSLIGLNSHPGMVSTTKEERLKFCDKPFYELIGVLMSNDSLSYFFIKQQEKAKVYEEEFIKNNKLMIQELDEL